MGLLYALLLTLLASCSSVTDRPGSQLTNVDGPAYLLTVELAEGDTEAEILDRHGGDIEMWVDGDFAVLGFTAQEAERRSGEVTLLGTGGALEPNHLYSSDPNAIGMQGTSTLWVGGTSTLWAGGTSRIWAGGTSYLWAGGTSYLWAGGHFAWMPENTAVWKQIRLDEAHQMVSSTLGSGIRVAVIDTGVDVDHPALKQALDQGYDFVDNDYDADEEGSEADAGYGHGTNVAGIVRQIAPRATIIPYRVLGPDGSGDALDLAQAIILAVTVGDADIVNLSLGGAMSSDAVDYALSVAKGLGVYVVASTGDSGTDVVTYPASLAANNNYLVSLTSVDGQDLKSDFAPFHELEVEMSSPGESIFGPAPDLKAAAWSGTSMSAPMAAGSLALALGAARGPTGRPGPGSNLAEVLMAQGEDIDSLNPDYAGKLGEGRLDVASYLVEVLGPGITPRQPDEVGWQGNGHGRGNAGPSDGSGGKAGRAADRADHPGRGHGKGR